MDLKKALQLTDDLFYGRLVVERVPSRTVVEAMRTIALHVDGYTLELLEETKEAEQDGYFNH